MNHGSERGPYREVVSECSASVSNAIDYRMSVLCNALLDGRGQRPGADEERQNLQQLVLGDDLSGHRRLCRLGRSMAAGAVQGASPEYLHADVL